VHRGRILARPVGLALALGLAAAPAVQAAGGRSAATACGTTSGLVCSDVVVPLDRSGGIPGTVSLHTEVLPAAAPRGAVFLIAGGPGQGSARSFDLGSPASAQLFQFLFPGYTLVDYDDRGTGASGLLDCPGLQSATSPARENDLAAACAASIGPQRAFFGTADHVEDLEAVRQSLGVARVALFGVSYGTKLALAYALAHPDHVERLVLDSVLPPSLPDPFSANVVRSLPATLAAFCASACRSATPDFSADVVALANRLAAKPVRGAVRQASGTEKTVRLDGVGLLSLVVDADLNPGLAVELPAAVRAARLGDPKPLLRLADLDTSASQESAADLSAGLYAATVCRDGPFPWPSDTPPAGRAALLQHALAALPAGTFGPFGSWAATLGNAALCAGWPSPSGGAPLGAGPLPDVPMLAISGGFDMRTPTASAASTVALFPQGHLLVVPGVGHSVVTADPSGCAARAVREWMLGGAAPATCARPPFEIAPLAAYPRAPARPAGALETYSIVRKAVHEAEASWFLTAESGKAEAVAGLYGGKLVPTPAGAFELVRYGIVPGVTVSGTLRLAKTGPPFAFDGRLTVGGRLAATGALGLVGNGLRGTLGGRPVGG
jgi:pimeloyl-ACP methyl ester carboxylesterase